MRTTPLGASGGRFCFVAEERFEREQLGPSNVDALFGVEPDGRSFEQAPEPLASGVELLALGLQKLVRVQVVERASSDGSRSGSVDSASRPGGPHKRRPDETVTFLDERCEGNHSERSELE
jgi:hypothetical protein